MAKDESCGSKHLKLLGLITAVVIGGILAAYGAASSKASIEDVHKVEVKTNERIDRIDERTRALEVNSEQIRTDVRWIRETMERDRKEGRP